MTHSCFAQRDFQRRDACRLLLTFTPNPLYLLEALTNLLLCREHRTAEHSVARRVDPADFILQNSRLTHLCACSAASVQVRAHAPERAREAIFFLQQKRTQLVRQRAGNSACHARAEHVVVLSLFLVARQTERADPEFEEHREVVFKCWKRGEVHTSSSRVLAYFAQRRHFFVILGTQQEQLLRAELGAKFGQHERS